MQHLTMGAYVVDVLTWAFAQNFDKILLKNVVVSLSIHRHSKLKTRSVENVFQIKHFAQLKFCFKNI